MKQINLTIKKTFLKHLLTSFIISIIIVFILLHFGEFHFNTFNKVNGWEVSYKYRNFFLNINTYPGIYEDPSEYIKKLNIYIKLLFSYHILLPILIGTITSLVIIYLFKFVKIKID
jgi:hypothetical protein